ncbi:MAG TPA: DNA-binding response regulator [Treponema sp.]|nr:DNA-binding response regulator [Treponema sp.]
MISIAIVEDEDIYKNQFSEYISKYQQETGIQFSITTFSDGSEMMDNYKNGYDIIFLDIQMKIMNGMETAEWIRKFDDTAVLIFITNMAQYAIRGYAVHAFDYILKPVSYFAFTQEMNKVVTKLQAEGNLSVVIPQKDGIIKLDAAEISYIESNGHNLTVHSEKGIYTYRDTIKKMEEKLSAVHFLRCNSWYLVNPRFVKSVQDNFVTVGTQKLQISRPKRKQFLESLTDYIDERRK